MRGKYYISFYIVSFIVSLLFITGEVCARGTGLAWADAWIKVN